MRVVRSPSAFCINEDKKDVHIDPIGGLQRSRSILIHQFGWGYK